MGYYVNTIDVKVFIDSNHFRALYDALCELNQHDEWKGGGSYGGEFDQSKPRPEGYDYHPGRWYSWMAADYPHKLFNAIDVLKAVGFDITTNEYGDIVGMSYDNKTGCEDVFLNACAPFMRSGSYIAFRGEDGEMWRYKFVGGKMYVQGSKVTWTGTTEFEPFNIGAYRLALGSR